VLHLSFRFRERSTERRLSFVTPGLVPGIHVPARFG